MGPRRWPARLGARARRAARREVPLPAEQRARQGRQPELRPRSCRGRHRRRPRRRPHPDGPLPDRHPALLRRREAGLRPDPAGLLQPRFVRARAAVERPDLQRGGRLLPRDRPGEDALVGAVLVRHLRPGPNERPALRRRRRHRQRDRGHPHDDPDVSSRLDRDLPQRGPRPRTGPRRRERLPAPAQPLGDRRDAGPAAREPAPRPGALGRPAAVVPDDALRLVRLVADARLHAHPGRGRPDRRGADQCPGDHLRAVLHRDAEPPVRRPPAARPRPLPADPVAPLRSPPNAGGPAGHAVDLRARSRQPVPGHAQGPQRRRRRRWPAAHDGPQPADLDDGRLRVRARVLHGLGLRPEPGPLHGALGGDRGGVLHRRQPRSAARRDRPDPVEPLLGQSPGQHPAAGRGRWASCSVRPARSATCRSPAPG